MLVRDVMKKKPIRLASSSPVVDAAHQMMAADVGAVIVEDAGRICGIVTDRDIAVRAVAGGLNPETTPLSEICSKELATLSPDDDLERAAEVMRSKAVRRVPVVDVHGKALGIVSLGDLAVESDPLSVLGAISAARPSRR